MSRIDGYRVALVGVTVLAWIIFRWWPAILFTAFVVVCFGAIWRRK